MEYDDVENILETYSLEEILEHNDLTEADMINFCVEQGYLELPELIPL